MKNCKFCNKECSDRGLKQHQVRCYCNPDKIVSPFVKYNKTRVGWNKGLTRLSSEKFRIASENAAAGRKIRLDNDRANGTYKKPTHTKEYLEELSKRQSVNPKGGKCKWYDVSGQKVQGTWERNIAQKLDKLNIAWYKLKTSKDTFPYITKDQVKRFYTPDFYLPEYNYYRSKRILARKYSKRKNGFSI